MYTPVDSTMLNTTICFVDISQNAETEIIMSEKDKPVKMVVMQSWDNAIIVISELGALYL